MVRKLFHFVFFLFLVFNVRIASAEDKQDNRPFIDAPFYSYTYYGGGNCVWFAWEMAYQHWGIKLPHIGDAKLWTELEGKTITSEDNIKYKFKLTDIPMVNSFVIFQPNDVDIINGYTGDTFGHIAYVYKVNPDDHSITVFESDIYPKYEGKYWHGCWWRIEKYTDIQKYKTMKFLYIDPVKD